MECCQQVYCHIRVYQSMKSVIADMALFNDLMYITTKYGIICNAERSTFRKTYRSLLDELGFEAY